MNGNARLTVWSPVDVPTTDVTDADVAAITDWFGEHDIELAEHRLLEIVLNPWRTTRTPPCPCECNRGGFCGGCGHAGCGGRR